MALIKEELKNRYPLPAYNYKVTIDSEDVSFSEITGLSIDNYDIAAYKDGLSFMTGTLFKPIKRQKPVNITFKRGVFKKSDLFFEWLKDPEAKQIDISMCDEDGTPIISWSIREAYPVKMSGPEVNATSKEVAIESLEVMAIGIEITYN